MNGSWDASRDGSTEPAGADGVRRGAEPGGGGVLLLTPEQAAGLLQVRESWLRRRAAERRVPCSFVGKHLRFSRADLEAIVAAGRGQRGRWGGFGGSAVGGRAAA